jgi:hypothetical protein
MTRLVGVLAIERDKRTTPRRRRKRLERLITDLCEIDNARTELHRQDGTKPPYPPVDPWRRS